MADNLNDSIICFVDETSITPSSNLQLGEHVIPIDGIMPDPLNVDSNPHANNSSIKLQENSKEIDSITKFHEDSLEIGSIAKFQDSLEIDSITKFQKNSLVFAKLSGHSDPPWPARVAKVCWTNGNHCGYEVFFYGTYQVGIVLPDKVWAYNEDSISEFAKEKISSTRKRADFWRGMHEIRVCPDIAPSRDIPESASQIAKKLMSKSSANNDNMKPKKTKESGIGEAVATSTPHRNNGKTNYPGINMTVVGKFRDKAKTSPWISATLSKLDESTDDEEIRPHGKRKSAGKDDGISSANDSSNSSISRRSKRIKKMPYWKRLEMKDGEEAGSQIMKSKAAVTGSNIDQTIVRPNKDVKSIVRPKVGSQVIPVQVQKGPRNKNKISASKEADNASPPPRKQSIENARNLANTSNNIRTNRGKQLEISPRPKHRRSGENGQSLSKLPNSDNDSTGTEDALENSNPTKTLQGVGMIVKEEGLSENPCEWSVAQTLSSILRMDPSITSEDIKALRSHKIDGSALIQLNFHDLVTYCQIKVGPAIKLSNLTKTLKAKSMKFQPSDEQF